MIFTMAPLMKIMSLKTRDALDTLSSLKHSQTDVLQDIKGFSGLASNYTWFISILKAGQHVAVE